MLAGDVSETSGYKWLFSNSTTMGGRLLMSCINLIYLVYLEIQYVLHVVLFVLNDPVTIWNKTCVHGPIVFDKSSTSCLHGIITIQGYFCSSAEVGL